MTPADTSPSPAEAAWPEFDEWREAAIEALARALYRADGFRRGGITPRWEFTDRVIQEGWRGAARRYVDGEPLRKPRFVSHEGRWSER